MTTSTPKENIINIDFNAEKAKRDAKGFYQRHKRKLKWGLYAAGGVAVVGGAYYAYTRLGGRGSDVIDVITEVAPTE